MMKEICRITKLEQVEYPLAMQCLEWRLWHIGGHPEIGHAIKVYGEVFSETDPITGDIILSVKEKNQQ